MSFFNIYIVLTLLIIPLTYLSSFKNQIGLVGRTGRIENQPGNQSSSIVESNMSLNRREPVKTGTDDFLEPVI